MKHSKVFLLIFYSSYVGHTPTFFYYIRTGLVRKAKKQILYSLGLAFGTNNRTFISDPGSMREEPMGLSWKKQDIRHLCVIQVGWDTKLILYCF